MLSESDEGPSFEHIPAYFSAAVVPSDIVEIADSFHVASSWPAGWVRVFPVPVHVRSVLIAVR